jgi:mannosyltransferase OCH1-like enzyme
MRTLFLIIALACSGSLFSEDIDIGDVDFETSMQRNYSYDAEFMQTSRRWQIVRKLYEVYQREQEQESSYYLIPPLIHFIWLGSPLPERCRVIIDTWRHFHPEWTIKIWTEEDLSYFGMQNKAIFDRAKNYGEKSDIWRYEILYRYGGLYVDTDFECLHSFEHIHRTCQFYAGLGYIRTPLLYNGLIGCAPGHPIMKQCVEQLEESTGDQNDHRIQAETGPFYFTHCFFQTVRKNSIGVVPFPVTFFYAFPNNMRKGTLDRDFIKQKWVLPESLALHYWEVSWVDRSLPNIK